MPSDDGVCINMHMIHMMHVMYMCIHVHMFHIPFSQKGRKMQNKKEKLKKKIVLVYKRTLLIYFGLDGRERHHSLWVHIKTYM